MRIAVKKASAGVFSISFDDTVVTLDSHQLKQLLLEAVKALTPGAMPSVSPGEEAKHLAAKLKTANPPGLQKFIMGSNDDDILALLKATEVDDAFQEAMFSNMSDRKHKMFSEDMEFRFKEGLDDSLLNEALARIGATIAKMVEEGALVYGG